MDILMSLYSVVLFVVLTPGVLITLPPGGAKWVVAVVHSLVFVVAWNLLQRATEGFQGTWEAGHICTKNNAERCSSGKCTIGGRCE